MLKSWLEFKRIVDKDISDTVSDSSPLTEDEIHYYWKSISDIDIINRNMCRIYADYSYIKYKLRKLRQKRNKQK